MMKDDVLRKVGRNVVLFQLPYFAFTFRLAGDSDFLESQQSNLEILVNERKCINPSFFAKVET